MENSPKNDSFTRQLSRYWLLLGVSALALAGLFSLVLVVARTPAISNIPLFAGLFHKALVVHVDLSVLVWFLSIACMLWSLLVAGSRSFIPCLEEAALVSFGLGNLALVLSPLDPKGSALMSNYIPVITSPLFFLGLSLVMCGVALMLLRLFTARGAGGGPSGFASSALLAGGIIALMSLVAFIWSFRQMPEDFSPATDGQHYYELLFWGGGHTLQFLHTQVLIVCWLFLSKALKPGFFIHHVLLWLCLSVGPVAALIVPFAYLSYTLTSMEHREFFTGCMKYLGGIAPLLLSVSVIAALVKSRAQRKGAQRALWSSLLMSVLLFLYGGFLGELIRGQNVVSPAHYHGSIVGVTLAFMGAAYLFLPVFGYRDVGSWRMAYWQPIVYGGGQLMHISGLAWSGGYGVLRKTPGGMDVLSTGVKAAMGFMGLGGLIAIIGGLMFVVVVWKSVKKPRAQVA
jgi:cytochrome c oxidase subunit 1